MLMNSASKNSMFTQPSEPTPDPDKGLKIYELPETSVEEFDRTNRFVIVQRPDGQLFKMSVSTLSSSSQGVDGIEFFDKEIILDSITINSSKLKNLDIPAYDLRDFDVPDSANFAIITIEFGVSLYPSLSCTLGSCFTYKVARGDGGNAPRSNQVFVPIVNHRLLITNVVARAGGVQSFKIKLHGYG